MNRNETIEVLAVLLSAWIHEKYPDPMPMVWERGLSDLSSEDCLVAAHRLTTNERYFPSLSRFREEAVYVARMNQRRQLPPAPQETGPSVTPEEAKANIAKMREMLRGIGKRLDDELDPMDPDDDYDENGHDEPT